MAKGVAQGEAMAKGVAQLAIVVSARAHMLAGDDVFGDVVVFDRVFDRV